MAIIKAKKVNFSLRINPYTTLGIPKGASRSQTKIKFREKMLEAKNDDELRAKICFAYDILVNNYFYSKCGEDIYKIKDYYKIAAYFYTVVGDSLNLISEIEKNEHLLDFKDH